MPSANTPRTTMKKIMNRPLALMCRSLLRYTVILAPPSSWRQHSKKRAPMLITFTCTAPNATEIGYLLGKNPASVYTREFSAGTVWVFYPEVTDERVSVALLAEIDPIALVRGPTALTQLDQYVNDRPYVASSLISVAL